jgi:small subunit ribosomal protein S21
VPQVEIRKGESIEKALRRLKRKIDREGILKQLKKHRHYEKPSERKRQKRIEAQRAQSKMRRYY